MSKISGPLLDRIDIHIDVPAVNYKEMRARSEPESSAQIRERVMRASGNLQRFCQPQRYDSTATPRWRPATFALPANFPPTARRLLERAMTQQGLTARAHDRILKVARTVADLEGAPRSSPSTSPKPSSTAPWIAPSGHRNREVILRYHLPDPRGPSLTTV